MINTKKGRLTFKLTVSFFICEIYIIYIIILERNDRKYMIPINCSNLCHLIVLYYNSCSCYTAMFKSEGFFISTNLPFSNITGLTSLSLIAFIKVASSITQSGKEDTNLPI